MLSFALATTFLATPLFAQRRPAPPPSRYSYTLSVDAKALPKGVTVKSASLGRLFISNKGKKPLIINERFHLKRRVSGAKLVDGKVYHYFPNGVPMQGKRHLKGWQAPFGVIKQTLLTLQKTPQTIVNGRKPGLSRKLPPPETIEVPANYDGKPYKIKVKATFQLNPAYDKRYGLKPGKKK